MSKTKWIIDPTHSEIGFKIKHLMITNVSGSFGKFNVEAETEGDNFIHSVTKLNVKEHEGINYCDLTLILINVST